MRTACQLPASLERTCIRRAASAVSWNKEAPGEQLSRDRTTRRFRPARPARLRSPASQKNRGASPKPGRHQPRRPPPRTRAPLRDERYGTRGAAELLACNCLHQPRRPPPRTRAPRPRRGGAVAAAPFPPPSPFGRGGPASSSLAGRPWVWMPTPAAPPRVAPQRGAMRRRAALLRPLGPPHLGSALRLTRDHERKRFGGACPSPSWSASVGPFPVRPLGPPHLGSPSVPRARRPAKPALAPAAPCPSVRPAPAPPEAAPRFGGPNPREQHGPSFSGACGARSWFIGSAYTWTSLPNLLWFIGSAYT